MKKTETKPKFTFGKTKRKYNKDWKEVKQSNQYGEELRRRNLEKNYAKIRGTFEGITEECLKLKKEIHNSKMDYTSEQYINKKLVKIKPENVEKILHMEFLRKNREILENYQYYEELIKMIKAVQKKENQQTKEEIEELRIQLTNMLKVRG